MNKWILAVVIAALAGPSLAKTQRIGGFAVKSEPDVFNDGEKYIATTIANGHIFALRCLNGEVTAAFSAVAPGEAGDLGSVWFKFSPNDEGYYEGLVLNRVRSAIMVQFGDDGMLYGLEQMSRLSILYEFHKIRGSFTIPIPGIAKVVDGARHACKLD